MPGSFLYAFHKVNFCCIFIQLSAEVLVALLILNAISGLSDAFSFTNSDKAFRLTPNILAASVTVKPVEKKPVTQEAASLVENAILIGIDVAKKAIVEETTVEVEETPLPEITDENINVELTESAIDLKNAELALEAAQQAAAKVAKASLLNYL